MRTRISKRMLYERVISVKSSGEKIIYPQTPCKIKKTKQYNDINNPKNPNYITPKNILEKVEKDKLTKRYLKSLIADSYSLKIIRWREFLYKCDNWLNSLEQISSEEGIKLKTINKQKELIIGLS